MITLIEGLLQEQQRVRELVKIYDNIPQGAYGAAMLREALNRAEQAVANEDVVAILKSYKELKDCE